MGFFTALLGGGAVVEKTIDIAGSTIKGVGQYIDDAKFTPEERSIAQQKAVETYLEWIKLTSTENSLWRVTRRWLAWAIVGEVVLLVNVSVALAVLEKDHAIEHIVQIANALWLGEGFTAVLLAYFGAGLLRIGKGE